MSNNPVGSEVVLPSFRVIEVPDNLEYWTLKPEHVNYIESINTVYLQETNTAWYMASSTPGYCAEPLYHTIDFKNEPSDEIREAISEYVDEAFYDSQQEAVYFSFLSEKVKTIPIELSEDEIREFKEAEDREVAISELWQSLIEDCRANHRI